MRPVSVDMKDLLEAEFDLGLRFTENLFIGREPSDPNETATIFDMGGLAPMQTLDPTEHYFYEPFQVRCRAENYERAYELCYDIMVFLISQAQVTVNEDTLYSIITCTSGPAHLEWDENNRCLFIVNFLTQRREVVV